jgi:hypothetical protein
MASFRFQLFPLVSRCCRLNCLPGAYPWDSNARQDNACVYRQRVLAEDRAEHSFPGVEEYVLDRLLLYAIFSNYRSVADGEKFKSDAPKAFARFVHIARRVDMNDEAIRRLGRQS